MAEAREVQLEIELGGEITVCEAEVTVYAITDAEPKQIETRVVEGSELTVRLPAGESGYFYAVATVRRYRLAREEHEAGERTLQFVAVFERGAENVVLNERSSVAAAYSFCRLLKVDRDGVVSISDPHQTARIALLMLRNFVGAAGRLSSVIATPPNGLETNGFALYNFLANLAYYGVADPGTYAGFLKQTRASSLFGAFHHLALDPFVSGEDLYGLISDKEQLYRPSLPDLKPPATPIPDQWTLTVKVNDSGAENFMIAGVGYVAFDKHDRVWIANNVRQGTANSSTFCVVLEPDGKPAPFSPLFGGGVLGAGFGIAAHPSGETIYVGNYGWGTREWNPQKGSVSAFSCDGEILSPSQGWTEGLSRVQGMEVDGEGNLWMASWGSQLPMPYVDSRYNFDGQNSAVVVYPDGDPTRAVCHHFDDPSPYHLTFDVTVDAEGNAYVSNAGFGGNEELGLDPVPSSIYKFRLENGQLRQKGRWVSKKGYEAFRQVSVAPDGKVYVGAVKTSRVLCFDPDLSCHPTEITNEIRGPWGIVFDPEGTMYVANFVEDMEDGAGPRDDDSITPEVGVYGVTVIRDGDESTAKYMTLPTGGKQVTLANGLPLYGNPQTQDGEAIPLESFNPIMRLTGTRIDRAGNLWACNNWKPSAPIDVLRGNPGGDGMVIFVGVAAPMLRS